MSTLTTDETLLYRMDRETLARHGRAVDQFARSAHAALADFTVKVLGLPPASTLETVMRAAAAAGLVPRCREIVRALRQSEEIERAYSETLRRRGLA